MSSRRLSIIIPALNESAVLPATLERLQDLRGRGHEVIVVDGESDDDTRVISRPLVDRIVESPRGRARQMNHGAAVASGQVFVFLHADTWLAPDCDKKILNVMQNDERVWGRFDVELSNAGWPLRLVAFAMNWRSRLTGIATGDQSIFVESALFDEVGGFPDIPLMEDVAMSRALKQITPPVCLRERVVTSSRRWASRGIVKTILTMWWLRLRYALGSDPHLLHRIYTRS